MGLSEDRRCAVNCVKCKLPIRAGEIAVRIDSQNMAHGQCATSANLSAQPQVQTIGVSDGEKLREVGTVHMSDRSKTRAIVDYQGLQYYADSIALDSDGKLIQAEAVPVKPQTIGDSDPSGLKPTIAALEKWILAKKCEYEKPGSYCIGLPAIGEKCHRCHKLHRSPDDPYFVAGKVEPGETVWLQTYLGRQLRVPEWNHDAICLEETAYVLSGIHRFGARTDPYYTVSEHSVRVADCIALLGGSALEQFIGINHEGDEALLGFDPASPLLRLLPDLKALKRLAHESYMRRYGLPIELPAIVKHADLVLLSTEKRDLMQPEPMRWMELPEPLKSKILPWPNPYARYMQRWRELAQAAGFQGKE